MNAEVTRVTPINRPTIGARIFTGVAGVAMLAYAAYLIFAAPDHYRIFIYVFVVPVLAIVQIFRSRRTGGAPTAPVAYPVVGAGQPAYPQQGGYQPPQT